jgi:hypothetical protein
LGAWWFIDSFIIIGKCLQVLVDSKNTYLSFISANMSHCSDLSTGIWWHQMMSPKEILKRKTYTTKSAALAINLRFEVAGTFVEAEYNQVNQIKFKITLELEFDV